MGPNLEAILKLEVPIIVRLGERAMSMGDVVSLLPGAIIELPKNADAELDLMVNNKAIGCGTAMKVGENFGIRITFIGDVKSRIEALGPEPEAGAADASADAIAEALLAGQA